MAMTATEMNDVVNDFLLHEVLLFGLTNLLVIS